MVVKREASIEVRENEKWVHWGSCSAFLTCFVPMEVERKKKKKKQTGEGCRQGVRDASVLPAPSAAPLA